MVLMSLYSFRLEMAWNDPMLLDNEAWALYRRLQVIAEKSPMQLNSFTLLKDGKEYPRSLKEYEDREEYDKIQRLEAARIRASELENELNKVKKVIDDLS